MHTPACPCPACKLIRWQAQKYRNQFYVDPNLPIEQLETCPMYDCYRFCPHGAVCFLPHSPPPPPPRSINAVIADLEALEAEHESGRAQCRVCGSASINHFGFDRVLPTAICDTCCQTLYCPLVPELSEAIFAQHSNDYQAFKTTVDETRARLPNSFRIPFSKEAHRIGCSKFAWSLIGEAEVSHSLRTAMEANPRLDRVVSVGASSGYVEYLYKTVAEKLRVPLHHEAYDEIPNPRFAVKVEAGGPSNVLCRDRSTSLLLLCWPPFGSQEKDLSTMGYDTLTNFLAAGGTTVVYIGDESSTGDFRFHALLAQQFRPARGYRVRHELRRWIPQEMGMVFAGQDSIGVYVRRPPAPAPGSALEPPPPVRQGAPPPPMPPMMAFAPMPQHVA